MAGCCPLKCILHKVTLSNTQGTWKKQFISNSGVTVNAPIPLDFNFILKQYFYTYVCSVYCFPIFQAKTHSPISPNFSHKVRFIYYFFLPYITKKGLQCHKVWAHWVMHMLCNRYYSPSYIFWSYPLVCHRIWAKIFCPFQASIATEFCFMKITLVHENCSKV